MWSVAQQRDLRDGREAQVRFGPLRAQQATEALPHCGGFNPEASPLLSRTGSQAFPELFSGCSLEQLADFMERARPGCLRPPGSARSVAAGPRCGDALLDPGEECDCGTVEVINPVKVKFEYVLLVGKDRVWGPWFPVC